MGTQKVTGTLLAADLLEVGFSSIIYCSACTWVHQIKVIVITRTLGSRVLVITLLLLLAAVRPVFFLFAS